ncbi:MAG: hypothetical protein JEZ07_03555 [Phycisphaerae bacterium]|nr:hypothetical protein [Phycisphaerae bacterium]
MIGTLNRIKRFIIAIMCGIVLLLLGYSIIDRLMASDEVLSTSATFAESEGMDWDAFLEKEKQALETEIVNGQLSHSEMKVSYKIKPDPSERALDIAMQFSVRYDKSPNRFLRHYNDLFIQQKQKFIEVLDNYKLHYMDHDNANRMQKNLLAKQEIQKQRQGQIELSKRQLEAKTEFVQRQEKYVELQEGVKEMLAAEALKLGEAIENKDGLAYQGYVQQTVQKLINNDKNTKKLLKKQQEYRDRQAELDIKAGQAEDNLLLATIAVERRELTIARGKIDEQILAIATELKEKLADELRQQYERETEILRTAKEQEIRRLESSIIAAKGQKENAQAECDTLQGEIETAVAKFDEEQADIEELARLTDAVRPEMALSPLNPYSQISIIQYMALIVLTLLGMALGWTLAPMGNKIYMVQKGKSLSPRAALAPQGDIPTGLVGDYETMAKQVLKLGSAVSPIILISGYGSPVSTVNLAIALSKEGKNILIIEAENNELSEVFDVDTDKGYRQWILGDIEAEQTYAATSLAGLSFMPAGKVVRGEAADKAGMTIGWLKLRRQFDTIVVYCPSALKAIMHDQDGGSVVDAADAIFVQTSEKMNKKGVALLEQKLATYELPLLGVVNN